jgi:hypothetical protein
MSLWPLFIPSKGRPSCPTLKTLEHLKATIIVEPQDEAAYRKEWPNSRIVVLPANNQGIVFVRNFILNSTRKAKLGWFWMLDDDITGFFVSENGKNIKSSASEVLKKAQQIIINDENIAQASLEYQQYSWSAKKDFAENSYADVCVAIHSERSSPIKYRQECVMKEDRDFTMQLIFEGKKTRRCSKLSFACPKNGSNAGGLADEYATAGREASSARRLAEIWPKFVSVQVKPDGRVDAKIDWKLLASAKA